MKPASLLALLACLLLPAAAQAQLYKCKSPSGSISLSDIPCPDSSPVPAAAPAPARAAPARSSVATAPAPASAAPARKAPDPLGNWTPPRLPETNEDGTLKRRAPSAKDLAEIRTLERNLALYPAQLTMACAKGDARACEQATCLPFDSLRGSPEAFRACVKTRQYTAGSYWAIIKGMPERSPQERADTIKLGLGMEYANNLDFRCYRKRAGNGELEAIDVRAYMNVEVIKGAAGLDIRETYSPRSVGKAAAPRYATAEQLANEICER